MKKHLVKLTPSFLMILLLMGCTKESTLKMYSNNLEDVQKKPQKESKTSNKSDIEDDEGFLLIEDDEYDSVKNVKGNSDNVKYDNNVNGDGDNMKNDSDNIKLKEDQNKNTIPENKSNIKKDKVYLLPYLFKYLKNYFYRNQNDDNDHNNMNKQQKLIKLKELSKDKKINYPIDEFIKSNDEEEDPPIKYSKERSEALNITIENQNDDTVI